MRHEVGIGDQDARCIGMGLENADRLAGLDEQRFILVQCLQGRDDLVEIVPGTCRTANAAIDHEFVGVLGNVGVEIVHQHPQRRFGHPGFGVELIAARRANFPDIMPRIVHYLLPSLIAVCSMISRMSLRCLRSFSALPSSSAKGGASVAKCDDCVSSIWIAWMPEDGLP